MKKLTKLSKGKLFLAITAITLVASMLMAGTYAWFVQTNDGENLAAGNTATVIAAFINEPDAEFTVNFTMEGISLYADVVDSTARNADGSVSSDIWNTVLTTGIVPASIERAYAGVTVLDTDNNIAKIYPSEGVEFTLDINGFNGVIFADTDHNREVVVEVDASELFAALFVYTDTFKDAALAANATDSDIIINIALKDSDGEDYDGDGIFYYYLEADEELTIGDIEALLEDFVITFGIVGHAYNQNHYMAVLNNPYFVLDISEVDSIGITVVQATEQAVRDVFGIDITTVPGYPAP